MSAKFGLGRTADRAILEEKLVESGVPRGLHDGLIAYILDHRPVGHFLTAVLSNDLAEACNRADDENKYKLWHIIFFLYNYAPGNIWGNPDKVTKWLSRETT